MAVVFDTYKQHQSLVAAGFNGPQAEAITDVATAVLAVVTTKVDLAGGLGSLEAKMDAKFDGIDKRLEDFNKTLGRMNALMIGQLSATIAGIGIIVGSMFAVIAPHLR